MDWPVAAGAVVAIHYQGVGRVWFCVITLQHSVAGHDPYASIRSYFRALGTASWRTAY